MLSFLFSSAIFAIYVIAAQGWGKATLHAIGDNETDRSLPYETSLGVATLIFVGGILNLTQIAYGPTIYLLVAAGLLFNTYSNRDLLKISNLSKPLDFFNKPSSNLVSIVITIFVCAFLIIQLLPTSVFNFHDDMHSYLMRIPLMLGSGTLGQNPIGIIGLDSLGAQPFMQSFSVSAFGLKYANGFDAVFCLVLSCALMISLAHHLKAHWLVTLTGLFALLLINMQQVNLSSIYSTTALILGLTHACLYISDRTPTETPGKVDLDYVPILLFCSSLIALKLLTAVFTTLFFILLFCTFTTNRIKTAKDRVSSFFKNGVLLTLFSLPWFLVHADKYANAIAKIFSSGPGEADKNIDMASNLENIPFNTFFSNQELFWGGNHFGYNSLFLLAAVVFAALAILSTRSQLSTKNSALTALCGATTISYVIGMLIFEYNMALRYSLPFLAASISITFIVLASSKQPPSDNDKNTASQTPLTWLTLAAALTLQFFLIYSFSQSFDRRMRVAQDAQGTLMFPVAEQYKQYIDASFSTKNIKLYEEIQTICPSESAIFAWVSSPFLFDFGKNRIYTMAEPQTLTPWYDIPVKEGEEAVRSYLLDRNIRCIVWEYNGPGMKSIKQYQENLNSKSVIFRRLSKELIALSQTLNKLAKSSTILHNSGKLVVFDILSNEETSAIQ